MITEPAREDQIYVDPSDGWFEDLLALADNKLRPAFVARYGLDIAQDVLADVMVWAADNTEVLREHDRPLGYLFRVGQSASRRYFRWSGRVVRLPEVAVAHDPMIEPGLVKALAALRPLQRTSVVLVHSFQWTYTEVAELLGIEVTAVNNHVHRGLAKLRRSLGVES